MKTKYTPYGVTKLIVCLLLLYLRIILHPKVKTFFLSFRLKDIYSRDTTQRKKKKKGETKNIFIPKLVPFVCVGHLDRTEEV